MTGARTRALLIAGGIGPATGTLPTIVDDNTLVVAVDGGLDTAERLGLRAHVVIGDMDSASSTALERAVEAGTELLRHPRDKDATDLELALDLVVQRGCEEVIVIAATGGRIDHELANIALLASPRWNRAEITMLDDRGRLLVVTSKRSLPVGPSATVTLIAMNGSVEGVSTTGLAWELRDADLPAGSTHGVSNVATSANPTVSVTSGTLLAVLPWGPYDDTPTLPENR